MALSGLKQGLQSGIQQGVKTGFTLSPMRVGLLSGIKDSTTNKDKTQDPTELTGVKKPYIFYTADSIPIDLATGFPLSTTITNLISGYNDLYETVNPTIAFNSATTSLYPNDFSNFRTTVDHTTGSKFIGCGTLQNPFNLCIGASFTFVCKPITTGTGVLCQRGNGTGASYSNITVEGGNRIRVSFTDSSVNTIFYESNTGSLQIGRYDLVTVVLRYSKPNGVGSEVEIYINGQNQTNYVSGSFVGSSGNFVNGAAYIGATATGTNASTYIASTLISEYAYTPIERIRLENWFRWYYGKSF
jgi:hypothetical protein